MGRAGRWQGWQRAAATAGGTVVLAAGLIAGPAASAATRVCRSSSPASAALAARLSHPIGAAVRHRSSRVGVAVDDPSLGITCALHSSRHFYSASVVKVTILAALLRKAHHQHRRLSPHQLAEAWRMITRSDNAAASYLWDDVGRYRLGRLLTLAGMRHTTLGPGGYWGLTRITAGDESLLLQLVLRSNPVLTHADRGYMLHLMSRVTRSQRWGTPAGVPRRFRVHVKNGWLPLPGLGWIINSLGVFTLPGHSYTMAVLTDRNSGMGYGIGTVEDVATAVNRGLNPRAKNRVARSGPAATWGRPDETIPLPAIPPP